MASQIPEMIETKVRNTSLIYYFLVKTNDQIKNMSHNHTKHIHLEGRIQGS